MITGGSAVSQGLPSYHLYLRVEQASLTPLTGEMVAQLSHAVCGTGVQWYRGQGQDITSCPYLGITVPSLTHHLVTMVGSRMFLGLAAEPRSVVGLYSQPLVRCRGEEEGPVVGMLVGRGGCQTLREEGKRLILLVFMCFLNV